MYVTGPSRAARARPPTYTPNGVQQHCPQPLTMSTLPKNKVVTFATVVGAVLVELRARTDLRQQDFAAAVGVAQTSWSRFERGERDLLVEQLVALARALHMPSRFVLEVAEDIAQRLERGGATVLWLREDLTPAVVAASEVLGVADLAGLVQKVMASEKNNSEFLARGFRRLLARTPGQRLTVAEALGSALPHAPAIGRRVDPKALKKKR
jgi:transcriptional regulator with XRE-family HTH domain